MSPRASVVMTVYNDLRFLDEATQSVLAQTIADFELILVDDGTGDASVAALATRDPRIRLITNARNAGAAAAGNRGIAEARSELIIRLDADDIAEPGRIERLLSELDRDSALGVVGSAVTLIDEAGRAHGVQRMPETDLEIRWTMLFHNPFYHPAVAFRKRCWEAAGRYKEDELVSHDHYLWYRMLDHCKGRNVGEPLIRYRLSSRGLTATHSSGNARARTHTIRADLWGRLGLTYQLYDNALAADVSRFLRGFEIDRDRRDPAYEVIRRTLRPFEDRYVRAAGAEERRSFEQFTERLLTRMRG